MTPSPTQQPGREPRRGAGAARPAEGTQGHQARPGAGTGTASPPLQPLCGACAGRGAAQPPGRARLRPAGRAAGAHRLPRALRSGPGMLRNANPSCGLSPVGVNRSRKAARGSRPFPQGLPVAGRWGPGLAAGPRSPKAAAAAPASAPLLCGAAFGLWPGPRMRDPPRKGRAGPAGLRPPLSAPARG